MSWSIFRTECQALTGMKHVSRVQYSRILSSAYHNSVMRHFDIVTGNGKAVTQLAKQPILFGGFLATCEANLLQHNDVNWLAQIGKYIKLYWTGCVITGPGGVVTVTSPGTWVAPKVVQNLNFDIMIQSFAAASKIHILSLQGMYVSSMMGITSPWFGGSLRTIP